MTFWGRKFRLNIIFDCYSDEEIIDLQKEAEQKLDDIDFESSLKAVKKYCLEDENLQGEKEINNIFKYVIPTGIFIVRDKKKRKIALLCDYKYDPEHGIAVLFENEKYKGITTQSDL